MEQPPKDYEVLPFLAARSPTDVGAVAATVDG